MAMGISETAFFAEFSYLADIKYMSDTNISKTKSKTNCRKGRFTAVFIWII